MDIAPTEIDHALMLDGNAAAGILHEIFTLEMTDSLTECANCGKEGAIGTLWAFLQAPGLVLRCPACGNVVLRIVQARETVYLDLRGAVFVRLRMKDEG
jgi:predicted RNA-binding Zn-ribbon protein involved in translation (DUF1610 family)